MNILVTGGVGFVGTNLIKKLLSKGYQVISVDNYSTGKKENEQKGCKYYYKDLANTQWWALWDEDYCEWSCDCQIEPVDVIYHLAALPRITPSFKKPVDTFKSGPMATINVLEWARHHETPVIYAGSSSVTGDVYANPYTFTKWQNEHLMKLYNELFNVPMSICRFYNVYGEHQANEGSYCNVLGIFERLYKEGKPLTITGDGEQRRDFTYVGDVVDANIKASNSKNVGNGEVINIGNGDNRSINEIAAMIGGPTEEVEPVIEPKETLAYNGKAKFMLDWKSTTTLEEWIPKWKKDIGLVK